MVNIVNVARAAIGTVSVLACLNASAGAADQKCGSNIGHKDALLVIDVQNDFMEETPKRSWIYGNYQIPKAYLTADGKKIKGGSLAVSKTSEIIPSINCAIKAFKKQDRPIFFSLDWHPASHCSFCRNGTAESNPGYYKEHGGFCGPLSTTTSQESFPGLSNLCQDTRTAKDFGNPKVGVMQWPDHCTSKTFGSRFHPYLTVPKKAIVIKKGFDPKLDAYSAFQGVLSKQGHPFDTEDCVETLQGRPTLASILKDKNIETLYIVGIATDYCVKSSAVDAAKSILDQSTTLKKVKVILPFTRWVADPTKELAVQEMKDNKVEIVESPAFGC